MLVKSEKIKKYTDKEQMENRTAEEKERINRQVSRRLNTELTADSPIIKLFAFDMQDDRTVIGTDEAGRGPAAGGVFASAVCFREKSRKLIEELMVLNDSKQLTKKKRESIYDVILNNTINATACVEVDEIEEINILNASLKSMKTACDEVYARLHNEFEIPRHKLIVFVDGNRYIKYLNYSQKFIIKGDAQSASIAAASVLAKVTRDRYMEKLDAEFPEYGWAHNAGYLTKDHLDAIDKYGLCKYHRKSFLNKHFAKEEQLKLF